MGGVYGYETRVRQQSGMAGCAARAWVPRTVWAGTSRRAAVPTPRLPALRSLVRRGGTRHRRRATASARAPSESKIGDYPFARIPRVRRAGELGPRTPPQLASSCAKTERSVFAHAHAHAHARARARHPRRVRVGAYSTRVGRGIWGRRGARVVKGARGEGGVGDERTHVRVPLAPRTPRTRCGGVHEAGRRRGGGEENGVRVTHLASVQSRTPHCESLRRRR
ncbi:hypothetical protein C8F04DRAFT_1190863 [Mycena alexandri]|uniref:Uncharacterized protein n=1 Tax=Mycena alexandri TaxID=1745969 RepID=A0AAD6WSZ8_9AGAR|nr:hypothetical protein C8F04DRAFT_1190863 [Mycena alexandri]